MNTANSTLVSDWFAAEFDNLHPMLQALHRQGGKLHGGVRIEFAKGVAGMLGRRLAIKMGVPITDGAHTLAVTIFHADGRLHWYRCFDETQHMRSIFTPVGTMDAGYWLENTGPVELVLTVDVLAGGWHWRCLSMRFWRIPLPLWLFPKSKAYKKIEADKYRFYVGFALPGFGTILSYSGLLEATLAPN